ncbi:MAG: hypothetical protein M1820_002885 [Bogoriella megaspora]|nr:MAG: hypothetical protein M1820_002885 [Bogoriella megaspora]
MSGGAPQTPQRLPGGFAQTPASIRQQPAARSRPPVYRSSSSSATVPNPTMNAPAQTKQIAISQQATVPPANTVLTQRGPIERAQNTVNRSMAQEAQFPDPDYYVNQGISSEYDVMGNNTAWTPFQNLGTYPMPESILRQYNRAQMSTKMGLFAELNIAWVAIDSGFYYWDFKDPNPMLSGTEDLSNNITAVKLLKPRAGVFKPHVRYIIVVATTVEIFILGVSPVDGPEGTTRFELTQTGMAMSIRGISVTCIASSDKTGRIFFGGESSNDVYELLYQGQVGWFSSNISRRNHSTSRYQQIVPSFPLGAKVSREKIKQMIIDDTRSLLYTLSSESGIRVFYMKTFSSLELAVQKSFGIISNDLTHVVARQSELMNLAQARIASINPIPHKESSRLSLMATTLSGCRIFFSASAGGFTAFNNIASGPPSTMAIHHVKFPPPQTPAARSPKPVPSNAAGLSSTIAPVETNSKALAGTHQAYRISPGYFFCVFRPNLQAANDDLFMSAPESGRIMAQRDNSQVTKYPELGSFLTLGGTVQDVGLASKPFRSSGGQGGFGNEMALQFDEAPAEIAVLTSGGVTVVRRRRLVDIFASLVRHSGFDEGVEAQVKKFTTLYGRNETMATALAVACGQGYDTSDLRTSTITAPDILDFARKVYVEYGVGARVNDRLMLDHSAVSIEDVELSSRYSGLALYVSRLTRSIWKKKILVTANLPNGGLRVEPELPISKLEQIQRDLNTLQEFLQKNKSFIEGLSGPEALRNVASRAAEVALQAEHQAMSAMIKLISNTIEGIAFILVLFSERTEDIILSLSKPTRDRVEALTFENLFCSSTGKDLAKELVKAIVNRNIAAGSSVDSVAEALRRRCGSFCSSDDVVIFKSQELLKKAAEAGANSEHGRFCLNESLKLFQKVAGALGMEHLQSAVEQYVKLEFFAGAVQLCLDVANAHDPSNRALAWIREGSSDMDPKKDIYEARKRCYELIYTIIEAVDRASANDPGTADGILTPTGRRKAEAYDVINLSEDEVFQFNLYDWYLSRGLSDRILETRSPYVVKYLERHSNEDRAKADLLWMYYARHHNFFEAAKVQLGLAKSDLDIDLDSRIEYLGRARTNASARLGGAALDFGTSGPTKQELLREASDLLDLGNIQADVLQLLKSDKRLQGARRDEVVGVLSRRILAVDDLYNAYIDPAGYFDLALEVFQVADYRNKTDIKSTWGNLITREHSSAIEGQAQPWERVADKVRSLGRKLKRSPWVFDPEELLCALLRYEFEHQRGVGSPHWVLSIFLDLETPREILCSRLEELYYSDEAPFHGRNRRYIANEIIYLVDSWLQETRRAVGGVLGGEQKALEVADLLRVVRQNGGLSDRENEECEVLRTKLEQAMR